MYGVLFTEEQKSFLGIIIDQREIILNLVSVQQAETCH